MTMNSTHRWHQSPGQPWSFSGHGTRNDSQSSGRLPVVQQIFSSSRSDWSVVVIERYNKISLMAGVPGIVLQVVGQIMRQNPAQQTIGYLVLALGTALLLFGLAYYAMAKGRNPASCLLAFLSIIGLIILACLSDLAPDGRQRR
jgi:hypothetical protein